MVHLDMSESQQLIFFGNKSLLSIIHDVCTPVAFFLMLSGYGLMCVYQNGDSHRLGRIMKLFVHYWVILLLFVSLGYWMVGPEIYPGNVWIAIENITSFHTSYNYECWFIFPFAMFVISIEVSMLVNLMTHRIDNKIYSFSI